jgi:TPP-dependent trihydroxycyclohexane-1,2-dione (THcHDO) dehydratase
LIPHLIPAAGALVRLVLRVHQIASIAGVLGSRHSARSSALSIGPEGLGIASRLTAVKHNMKITHVRLNNGQLGKISKEQRAGDREVWQTSLHNPDFSKYAEICGALGIRVTEPSQLDDALAAATAHDGPTLIEVLTDPDLI